MSENPNAPHNFDPLFYNTEECHICGFSKSHELHEVSPKKIGAEYSTRSITVRCLSPEVAQIRIFTVDGNQYLCSKFMNRTDLKLLQAEITKVLEVTDWE